MTSFLKTVVNSSIALGSSVPLKVFKPDDYNVVIDLGYGNLVGGNRKEDFESLKVAVEEALKLFEPGV